MKKKIKKGEIDFEQEIWPNQWCRSFKCFNDKSHLHRHKICLES